MTLKQKEKVLDYISKGILIIAASFAAFYSCRACSEQFVPNAQIEISRFNFEMRLSPTDEHYYKQKRDNHLREGNFHLQQAHDICWYLPNYDDRRIAKEAWNVALTQMNGAPPQARLCAALVMVLGSYGLDCVGQWNQIQTHLNTAEYHFEMYDFYVDLLARA